jgi:hypothetical protein
MLRAHAVEVRGRRAGPGAHELLAGCAGHLYATWMLGFTDFLFFSDLVLK